MTGGCMIRSKVTHFALFTCLFVFFWMSSAWAVALQPLTQIPIPNWTITNPATGTTTASFDLLSYDPNSKLMFVADRPNHGITVIDTVTNTYKGTIVPPGCA